MNILQKLNTLTTLTRNERILADFIIQNPNDFINMKPKEIASLTYVSVPTLYRLVNKLDLMGINDLKMEVTMAIANQGNKHIEDIDYPILPSDTNYEIMCRLQDVYTQTIQDTLSLADPDTLVTVANKMKDAKEIDVYAASANVYFAENFQFQMMEIGKIVNVPKISYMQGLSASNSDSSHYAIIISFGGRTASFLDIIKILKQKNVSILLITSTQGNPLCEYADEIIYMSSFEDHYHKISSFSTRMTLLYILDTIYAVYFKMNYDKNIDYKIENYQRMSQTMRKE